MFTPQEVSEKVFPKASGFGGGYQMAAVDEFLDTLTEDYTALFKDNVTLKAKLKVLAEKVEEYRATEDSMRATLLTAQRMAAKLVQEAQEEKENMVAQARKDAAAEIAQLNAETEEYRRKLDLAKQSLGDFLARSKELIDQQSAFLAALPEMNLTITKPTVTQDTVSDIGEEILQSFSKMDEPTTVIPKQEDEEVPAEEPEVKSEEREVPAGSAIPADFKLSIDELKFGRNYGGSN